MPLYYSSGQNNKNEMGGACSAIGVTCRSF